MQLGLGSEIENLVAWVPLEHETTDNQGTYFFALV